MLRDGIIDMWTRDDTFKGMPDVDLHGRAREVVLAMLDSAGSAVGITTAYVATLPRDGLDYYFLRAYVQPASRIHGMVVFALVKTCECLSDAENPYNLPGVIVFTENPWLELGVQR